ncbi:MAG TPA: hypothetical protein VGS96_08115 [Thermoanaerobaculia bacterium]|nr:hypothetical protein [Thermoanaerobaculia bacterium]
MTFYVQKSLAHGPIRFGVSLRQTLEDIDSDAALSTGPSGEFLRRRSGGFYFADARSINAPSLPESPTIARTPFWTSLRGEGRRSAAYLASIALGAIFALLGIAVLIRKGRAGWVEVILGAIMIGVPIVLTAQKRRQIRMEEERVRAEREERERRHRAMLEAYVSALQRLRENPSEETLDVATREREALELPYELWSPLAKRTVLQIGFEALARLTPQRAREVSDFMSHASEAVGLSAADEVETKLDLYRVLVWHLLADDLLGKAQAEQLKLFRKGFDIWDRDAPVETQAIEEFHLLRGLKSSSVPRKQCGIRLQFREYCVHSSRATLLSDKRVPRGTGSLFVTNKRVLIDMKKPIDIPLAQIDDLEVNIDANLLTIRAARPEKPVIVQVEQPIYTAALIDLATSIDERPRGFA